MASDDSALSDRRQGHVFNIPAGVSFADALARGLLRRFGGETLGLSAATLLLPTRRACRTLREAFLRAAEGRALLLPRLLPLGDLDAEDLLFADEVPLTGSAEEAALPPALPGLRRLLLLTRLVLRWGEARAAPGDAFTEDQAIRLAGALARLQDQVETEGLSFDRLETLVPEDYAEHWQTTLAFLRILSAHWPAVQAEEGAIGPAERRRRLLEAQAALWRRQEDAIGAGTLDAAALGPVIVAGSTGSIPATADLIATVAALPQGLVVLPGLDRDSDAATWRAIERDASHPQHGLAVLLRRMGLPRAVVEDWPEEPESAVAEARGALLRAALMPSSRTPPWQQDAGEARTALGAARVAEALAAVHRIDCAGPGEEAEVIALILRQALTRPERTAALVTPDRALARRVAAELRRWSIEIDDSAGQPLGDSVPGSFLRLTADLAVQRLAPVPLLAALKHPLAAGGRAPAGFRAQVRALELAVLRGPRPGPGIDGLRAALATPGDGPALPSLIRDLGEMVGPFQAALDGPATGLGDLVAAHLRFAEALAASADESGASRLWSHDAGESLADLMEDLLPVGADTLALPGHRYPAALSALLAGQVVRPRYGRHPRVAILGPLEARLRQADVMVLGGLNEGTWPGEVDPGPWLSRPMRRDFGLPPPERRVGLAAHDFVQALAAPEVYLTRATRVEGTPTRPSRWLLRLDAALRGLAGGDAYRKVSPQWQAWAADLDRPADFRAIAPPAPRPPLAARPRSLSVTQVETWMRDPYSLYAAKILDLKPLDRIDADPGLAERGTMIHRSLEQYLRRHPETAPADAEAELLRIGEAVFRDLRSRPGLYAFWWPRFQRIAAWFAEADRDRRAFLCRALAEVRGSLSLETPGGAFTLIAKADRIEVLRDGGLAILDYKTGAVPDKAAIRLGFSPQLPLEGAIAAAGGFEGVPAQAVEQLLFWRLTGGAPPGEAHPIGSSGDGLGAIARAGLEDLIAAFDREDTPYSARPRADWAPRFDDYGHLARVGEWAAGGTGERA